MKLLIIGGAGYIGGATAHLAANNGHHVTVFDDLSSGLKSNLPEDVVLIKGDVTSESDIKDLFASHNFDAVLHFAAKILVPESIAEPYLYLHTNSFGVLNTVEHAAKVGVKNYILSSTAAVYGAPHVFPITEDTDKAPINPYGESKLIAEHILASYEQARGLNWLAFRYFNVAGAYDGVGPDYPFISHIIPALLDRANKGQVFSINGNDYDTEDGTCVRDFVHVYDIAAAHVAAAERMVKGQHFKTAINLGSASGYSVKQITEAFIDITRMRLQVSYAPRRTGDPDKLVASNAKAKQLLDWRPTKSLRDIIIDHYEWYKDLPESARVKNIS